jgi:hypothetical protein
LVTDAVARLGISYRYNILLNRIIDANLFIVRLLSDGSWGYHHLNYGEK